MRTLLLLRAAPDLAQHLAQAHLRVLSSTLPRPHCNRYAATGMAGEASRHLGAEVFMWQHDIYEADSAHYGVCTAYGEPGR